jgi:hypothetical protein
MGGFKNTRIDGDSSAALSTLENLSHQEFTEEFPLAGRTKSLQLLAMTAT